MRRQMRDAQGYPGWDAAPLPRTVSCSLPRTTPAPHAVDRGRHAVPAPHRAVWEVRRGKQGAEQPAAPWEALRHAFVLCFGCSHTPVFQPIPSIESPNHVLKGLFRIPNWAMRRVGSDCARCLTTMQSFWTAARMGCTSEDPSASHRRRVGCPPIRPDFPLLDSRASASESVLPSSATSSPLRGSLPPPGHDHGVGYPRSPKSEVQASPYLGQKACQDGDVRRNPYM